MKNIKKKCHLHLFIWLGLMAIGAGFFFSASSSGAKGTSAMMQSVIVNDTRVCQLEKVDENCQEWGRALLYINCPGCLESNHLITNAQETVLLFSRSTAVEIYDLQRKWRMICKLRFDNQKIRVSDLIKSGGTCR